MKSELLETFKQECEKASGKVSLARSREDAERSLSEIISKEGVNKVMLGHSLQLGSLDLDHLLMDLGIAHIVRSSNEHLDESALKDFHRRIGDAEMGITGVDYGLADTGTLVLMARSDQDRLTSLLPPMHIAVLQTNQILTGLDELCVRLMLDMEEGRGLNSCITFITGPSKTADIEMTLVRGIHGPKELHVILLDYV
jgi:L-lactate dehydrogenase complex protein LldG